MDNSGREEGSTSAPLPGQVREEVPDLTGTVVVGTDGSLIGRAAVRFAAREARVRSCPLVAIRCWSLTTAPEPAGSEPGVVPPMTAFEQAVADQIEVEMQAQVGPVPDIEVVVMPVHGAPGDVLVEASRSADLVVVGSRGHSTVAGVLLGSVSDHLVRHGHGPVAVVRSFGPERTP